MSSEIKALEHATVKVPYEALNRKFRNAQKNIEREVSRVHSAVGDIETALKSSELNPCEIEKMIDGVIDRLKTLKRKSEESLTDEVEAVRVVKRRLDHLKEYSQIVINPELKTNWQKKRMDRILVDHLLRRGFYESAVELTQQSNIEDLVNIDVFLVAKEIEESLQNHDTNRCLQWCYENKSKLKKLNSTLEFNLRKQEFIELIRSNKKIEAVLHARKYFSQVTDMERENFQQVMGLLVFGRSCKVAPYDKLLDTVRWDALVEEFRESNFALHQISSQSVLTVVLQAGLSALKTPYCYQKHKDSRTSECPVCSTKLNKLADGLPFAQYHNSRLVDYVSGEPLNEHNPPMMLPNGRIYGENTLFEIMTKSDGTVTCPRTKEKFTIEEVEKVFIL